MTRASFEDLEELSVPGIGDEGLNLENVEMGDEILEEITIRFDLETMEFRICRSLGAAYFDRHIELR